MSRRKMNKDKEQIRNYYFNSYKLLKSTAPIDEGCLICFFIAEMCLKLFSDGHLKRK